MKIVQVNKLYFPHIGGVEKHVQDVAEALRDKVDVEVVVANTSRAKVTETINGVKVTRLPSWGVLQSAPIAPGFLGGIRRSSADIYHLHFPNPVGELAYLMAGSPGKLVITYHADIVRQRFMLRFYGPFIKKILKRADAILVSSPNLVKSSPWLEPVSEKCRVVPFAIDLKPFKPTKELVNEASVLRSRYGSPLILFVGRLIYYKGLSYLVDAMKDVEAKLAIIGEGKLEEELKQQAADIGVDKKILFLSRVDNQMLSAYLHACDFLVLPSIASSEAFGFVQLEAHACGKPVISTNLPTGVPYANLDGKTGLIVPPEDSKALSDAMNRLLNDSDLRTKLGAQAKARVEAEFTYEAMADAILKIYEDILDS